MSHQEQTVDRRYEGDERSARVAYQADATSMIAAGWSPVTQRYVGEGWGKGHLEATYAWTGVPEPSETSAAETASWVIRLVVATAVLLVIAVLIYANMPGHH